MMASTKRDSTRAVSAMVSPWPSCISAPDSTSVSPPIWRMPTSKLTRVRVEGFSKTSATTRPASGCSASGSPRGVRRAPPSSPRHGRGSPRRSAAGVVCRSRKCLTPPPRRAAAAASSRRRPSSASASVRFSGGSSRTTLSAADDQDPLVVAGAHHLGVRDPALEAEHQPLAAHPRRPPGARRRAPRAPGGSGPRAADLVEEFRRRHPRPSPRCRPRRRAGCRRRSNRGCRAVMPRPPLRWRGRRRAESPRRSPWPPS